jgi:hypothetical protein
VLGKDIGHGARYRHHRLRFGNRRPPRPTTATAQSYTRPAPPSRVILPDRSPQQPKVRTSRLVGLGRSPVS